MPRWITTEAVISALGALNDYSNKLPTQQRGKIWIFLSMKLKGVNNTDFTEMTETDDKSFWDNYFKLDDTSNPYFDPLNQEFRIASHYHSNVATARKNTFLRRWSLAEADLNRTPETWKFTTNYISIFKEKMSVSGTFSKMPIFAIGAWILRNKAFDDNIDAHRFLNEVIQLLNIKQTELNELFSQTDYDDFSFTDKPPVREMIYVYSKDPESFNHREVQKVLLQGGVMTANPSIDELESILEFKKQVILQGPPGTGKTHTAKRLAMQFLGLDDSNFLEHRLSSNKENSAGTNPVWELVQFHQNTTYDDFIRGAIPDPSTGSFSFEDKVLLNIAKWPHSKAVLIIDEINRANLSAVLGEMIYALEYRGEGVESLYPDSNGYRNIHVPETLCIIGTMNSADRSIALMDVAIRRRFAFVDIEPDRTLIEQNCVSTMTPIALSLFDQIQALTARSPNHRVGHTYFFASTEDEFKMSVAFEVLPLLKELAKEGVINGDDQLEVSETSSSINDWKSNKLLELL
jgi:hypothetical protein